MTNDKRNMVVADGRTDLCVATGLTSTGLKLIPSGFHAGIVDEEVARRLIGGPVGAWFQCPFPANSEPNKRVLLRADSPNVSAGSKARVMRLSTLRSVDSYVHRFRSNVRFAGRPQVSTGGHGRTRGRHHLYDPSVLAKLADICRFHHAWMKPGADKETPAMRIGLARGRIHERDLM